MLDSIPSAIGRVAEGFLIVRLDADRTDFVPDQRELGRINNQLRKSIPSLVKRRVPAIQVIAKRSAPESWDVRIESLFCGVDDFQKTKVTEVDFSDDTSVEGWYEFWKSKQATELRNALETHGGLLGGDEKAHGESPSSSINADAEFAEGRTPDSNAAFVNAVNARLRPNDSSLNDVVAHLVNVQSEFRSLVANEIAQILNARISTAAQDTFEQKQELCEEINSTLQKFSLAVACPKTNAPSRIFPERRPSNASRFCFDSKAPDLGRRRRTATAVRLDEIGVVEDQPRREPLREWRQRSNSGDSAEKNR